MNFSVLIPTRKRVVYLNNLILSIYNTAKFKNEVEILITYDDDDQQTMDFVNNFQTQEYLNISFFKRPRSLNINGDYYNWMAKNYAKGKYFIISNDDAQFIQQNWDEMAWKRLEEYEKSNPDGLVLGIIDDKEVISNRHDYNRFSCFPLFSRKDLEVLGFLFQPEYWRDGADWVIAGVYRKIDRVLDLRNEIIIEHISVRSFRRNKDDLYEEYTTLQHMCPSPPKYDVITRDAKILQFYIENKEIIGPHQVEYQKDGWVFYQSRG
jgi:hypothetical protein